MRLGGKRRLMGLLALVCAAWLVAGRASADPMLKPGERLVFYGDSITEQRIYTRYVMDFFTMRYPGADISFRNAGWGGDTAPGGLNRLQRDVISLKPNVVTIDFGMNDGGYSAFTPQGFKNYVNGLKGIADQARAAGIRVAWLTPSPVEKAEIGPAITGYNETLEKYSQGVKEVAIAYGGTFADQFHPFVAAIDKVRAERPTSRISADAVHPGSPGQAIMAWAILKGLSFPRLVSTAEIDAATGKVAKADHCTVDAVVVRERSVKFQRQDQALPFFPAEAQTILKWEPILDELNEYGLKVTGLRPGQYDVLLDGAKLARYSNTELSAGVNLSAAVLGAGPVAQQIKDAWKALVAKNQFHHDQIFNSFLRNAAFIPDWLELKPDEVQHKREVALRQRTAHYRELQDALRQAIAPRPHSMEVVPAQAAKGT